MYLWFRESVSFGSGLVNLVSVFQIPISALVSFVEALEVGYSKHKNPYHNLMHAADVTQTVHYLLYKTGVAVSADRRHTRCEGMVCKRYMFQFWLNSKRAWGFMDSLFPRRHFGIPHCLWKGLYPEFDEIDSRSWLVPSQGYHLFNAPTMCFQIWRGILLTSAKAKIFTHIITAA